MNTLRLRIGNYEKEVVDCKSCQMQDFVPRCIRGLDMAGCGTCEHREARNGDYSNPPLILVSLPNAKVQPVRSEANSTPEGQPTAPQVALTDQPSEGSRMRGLGDAVAKVTKTLGIKECGGCKKRREALNKLVPFKNGDDPKPEG